MTFEDSIVTFLFYIYTYRFCLNASDEKTHWADDRSLMPYDISWPIPVLVPIVYKIMWSYNSFDVIVDSPIWTLAWVKANRLDRAFAQKPPKLWSYRTQHVFPIWAVNQMYNRSTASPHTGEMSRIKGQLATSLSEIDFGRYDGLAVCSQLTQLIVFFRSSLSEKDKSLRFHPIL